MATNIVIDMDGVNAFLREGTPELREALAHIGHNIMDTAADDSLPRRHDRYRRSFGVDVGELDGRFAATIYNTDYTAVWVELGAHAHHTPILGYHVMARALEANRVDG